MHQPTHPGVPSKDALRMAAAALTPSEFLEHRQNLCFLIDIGAIDGKSENQNILVGYFAEHSKMGGDL